MTRLALITALTLSACTWPGELEDQIDEWAGRGPDFVTERSGLVVYNVYDLKIPSSTEWDAEIDRVLGMYARQVPQEYWSTRYLRGLEVHVMDGPITYGGREYGGIYSPGTGITIWLGHPEQRPLDDTPFAHELGHNLTQCCADSGWVSREYGVP